MRVLRYSGEVNFLTQNYLTRGFWGDEAWTALISQFSLTDILRITGEDFHPPLYYFLAHFFIALFGASEWIRAVSVAFFGLTVIAAYFLAREFLDRGMAWLTALLILTSPILVTYAFEARAYALVAFISTAATLVFWKALRQGSGQALRHKQWRWWVAYVLLGIAGMYTHYYLWFIFAAHGLYWLAFSRQQFGRVLVVYMLMLAGQAPWVQTLLSQVGSVAGDYWIAPINSQTHWEFFVRVTAGDDGVAQQKFAATVVLMLLGISLLTMVIKGKSKRRKGYWFLWFWLLVPVVLPTLISLYRPIFFYRYLIFSSIPILVIIFWGLSRLPRWLYWGAGGFLLALYLSINLLSLQRYPHTMREELTRIRQEMGNQDYQLVTVLPSFAEVMYYNKGEHKLVVLPEGIVQFSGKSLLDAFVRKGAVTVLEPPTDQVYWLIEPGPKATLVEPES